MNSSQGSSWFDSRSVWQRWNLALLALPIVLAAPLPVSAQNTPLQRNTTTVAPLNKATGAAPRSQIGGSVRAPIGTMSAALSAEECSTLGGKSVVEGVCNSGKACETTTQDGDWKRVCLSKAD